MRIDRLVFVSLAAFGLMHTSAIAKTPAELGWEAGVVAPSPLKPTWENKKLTTKSVAEKAKEQAREEIARIKKIRDGQRALCQEKIFVNACLNKAEDVLRDRERFANQLLRSADHQLRIFGWQEKKAQPKPSRMMPKAKGDRDSISDEELKEMKRPVTERARQELANEKAFDEKQKAQEERRERLKAEAQKRKERREARRAEQEAEKKAREAAQQQQEAQKNKSSVFF